MSAKAIVLYPVYPIERKTPLRARTPISSITFVDGRRSAQAISVSVAPAVVATSTVRNFATRSRGVVAGLISRLPKKRNNSVDPARAGDHPKPSWKSNGSRNAAPLMPTRNAVPPTAAARNVLTRKASSGTSGDRARKRWTIANVPTATVTHPSTATTGQDTVGEPRSAASTTRQPSEIAVLTKPIQSSGPGSPRACRGMIRKATPSATIPSGRLIRKIHGHVAYDVMSPPTAGANTGATSAGQVRYATALMMLDFPVARRTTNRPTGTIIAPPAPCATRMMLNSVRLVLKEQSTEASVKRAMAKRNVCRAPRRAANQPLTGMSAATVARYAVAVMPICDDVTPKDRAMLGAAVSLIHISEP